MQLDVRLKECRGISLIEVLLSVFILSVAVIGVIRIYYFAAYEINLARHSAMAVNLAQARLEELLNTKYNHLDTADFPISENNEDGFVLDPNENLNCGMDTKLYSIGTEAYMAVVTVWWQEPFMGAQRDVSQTLRTIITDYEGSGA